MFIMIILFTYGNAPSISTPEFMNEARCMEARAHILRARPQTFRPADIICVKK